MSDQMNSQFPYVPPDSPANPTPAEASGLPQSEHGGLHPELRARITAITATVADFNRENLAWIGSESDLRPDYPMWAMRMAGELGGLLETIGRLS